MDENLTRRIREAKLVVSRVRLFLLVIPPLCGVLGYMMSFVVAPKYRSSETVSLKDQDVFNNLLKDLVAPVNTKTSTASAKALLYTAPVLDRVARTAGMVDDHTAVRKRQGAYEKLQSALSITSSGAESAIFTLDYVASDPLEAQRIVSAFSREFVRETVNLRIKTAQLALRFLKGETERIGAQLEQKRREAAQFRSQSVFSLPDFALDGTVNLLQMRKELTESKAKLAETDKRLSLIREFYRKADPRLTELKTELGEIERQMERFREDYTPEHPFMRDLTFKRKQILHMISVHHPDTTMYLPRDRATVAVGLDGKPNFAGAPGMDAFMLGRQFQEQDLLLQKEMMEAKIAQMDSLFNSLKISVEQIPDLQRKLAQSQTEIDNLEKSHTEIQQRYLDARHSIEVSALDAQADFAVISPANLPGVPFFPVRSQFLMAGGVMGAALVLAIGFLMSIMKGNIRERADVELGLGLRYLGTLPDLRRKKKP